MADRRAHRGRAPDRADGEKRPKGPPGAWPMLMRAETAAAFVDEPSVETFRRKVGAGLYPAPYRVVGDVDKWHIKDLLDHGETRAGRRPDGGKSSLEDEI